MTPHRTAEGSPDSGFGIVIVAHEGLAEALHATLVHIMGPVPRIAALGISDVMEGQRGRIVETVRQVDTGTGVVIAADMHGGSPCNLALQAARETGVPVEVVAGASLPMLVALVENRTRSPREAVEAALARPGGGTPGPRDTDSVTRSAERRLSIPNRRGLHARASARFTEMAERFESSVTVSRDGFDADGGSILDLLMLAAPMGSSIQIRAEGPDAEDAVTALAALVDDGFGESD